MAHFEEKAKLVEHVTPHFTWSQTVQEVHIKIALPVGTRGRNVICEIKPKSIKFQVKGQEPILDGELFGNINHKESIWSLEPESGEVFIILHKTKKHETWESVVKGFYELDLLTKEEMGKKMMLEKFQSENPGFDFTGAEIESLIIFLKFTGQLPKDPANFGLQK